MNTLVLAVYAEGRIDERFLPIIIQRTAEQILIERGQSVVDVLDPIVLDFKGRTSSSRADRILGAARQAAGYHALVVHADADYPTPDRAMRERIQPGFDLAREAGDEVCEQLVGIVPVRMTEAWMLADLEALQSVIGTNLDAGALGIPQRPKQVEADSDPKQTLRSAIQNALIHRRRRSRRINLDKFYEPLARHVSLKRLQAVPAYRRFVHDLTETLIALHLAQ